jgi:hypothetical protein
MIDRMRQLEHSRVSLAALRAGPAMVARKCGPAGPYRGRGPAWADNESSRAVLPENLAVTRRTNQMCSTNSLRLRRRHHQLPGFIAAVTRTAGPRPFGGAGLWVDQWLGGRDSELTCVCSRTGVSIWPGDSYPAVERLANVSVRRTVPGQASW